MTFREAIFLKKRKTAMRFLYHLKQKILMSNAEYDEYEQAFISLVPVDVEEYARKHFNKSVKKTLSIPSWLNEKAIKQSINFSQLLQDTLIKKLNT